MAITPALRKRIRADVARLLPAHAQPSPGQWKLILGNAISTCVVAGAGSGKSSSLVLRIVVLTQYLGVPLEDISVVTFTRASRADFAERLVRLFALWGQPLTLSQARARVTTFHATVLTWARTLPGFVQLQAFESLGAGEGGANPFQLRINEGQRQQLNHCYQALLASDPEFATVMQALRVRASQLPPLPEGHPEVQRRMAALVPAAQRDAALCELIAQHWRQAGHWPLPGVVEHCSEHRVGGQVFRCHGRLESTGAWVVLGADPSLGELARPGAKLPVRAEWAVKRTLFQAFFDKPLIWLDSFDSIRMLSAGPEMQGPGLDYALAGEAGPQPLLDAFVATASFIENLGLEVPTAAATLADSEDGVFFQALGRYWPALERQLLALAPPVLSYNRMFAIFSDPHGGALKRLPDAKLTAIRHLLVDEFQDISPQIARWLRAGLAERLRRDASTPASFMCVGDDWQSIYGWRGSSPAFFMHFAQAFPSPKHQRLLLKENFRSTQQIIDGAEYIVRSTQSIPGKKALAAGIITATTQPKKIQLRWKDPALIAQVAQESLGAGLAVLMLYRQAKDDPRQLAPVAELFEHQARLPAEQRRLRCMTIHGAKGLEADVVILIGDCVARPASSARNRLYALAESTGYSGADAYDRAQADEALRLAYVGITRAAREVHWYVERTSGKPAQPGALARTAGAEALFEDKRR
ncbi:UvrD-helicase domain-containing protein [Pseudomonas sp. RIT-PI-S]|uniref:UvrD-helicase domain-containing protein n=1 Tax=Pseudomonas sp. RIT-PI-S TaxID=3035295 RepID=UPI0021D97F98|nr:UvrD-helicase domain-containing protein [Pseudomonas sp. RIT-PI-S]